MLMSFGSVPSSGRPPFDMTLPTSGIVISASRMRRFMVWASVNDTDGGYGTLSQTEPSLSSGKNSVPSFGTTAMLAASAATASITISFGRSIAQRRTGW